MAEEITNKIIKKVFNKNTIEFLEYHDKKGESCLMNNSFELKECIRLTYNQALEDYFNKSKETLLFPNAPTKDYILDSLIEIKDQLKETKE